LLHFVSFLDIQHIKNISSIQILFIALLIAFKLITVFYYRCVIRHGYITVKNRRHTVMY
jgi:hypothetical protein